MRRLIAAIADAVSAPIGTSRRLALYRAVIAVAARAGRIPRDSVTDVQRLPAPVPFEPVTELHDASDRFMTENDGQCDRHLALPEMYVGAADARHHRAHQGRAPFHLFREREFPYPHTAIEFFE